MNPLIAANTAIFAVVFSLFALETGVALLNLFAYKDYGEKADGYIKRSWAISGTFMIFYVVNFEATFPLLLTAAGTLYIVPVLLAGLLLIFRNAFIAYSEHAGDIVAKKTYTTVYAVATILAVFVLVSVLSSTVTGTGISLGTVSIGYVTMFLNPYNIIMFACAAAVSLLGTILFFNIGKPFGISKPVMLAALVLVISATFFYAALAYTPFVAQGLVAKWYYLVPALAMLTAAAYMYITGKRMLNIATFVFLVAAVAGFETLGHPDIFGGALSIYSFMGSQSGAYANLLITSFTALVLLFGIGLLLYAHSKSRAKQPGY